MKVRSDQRRVDLDQVRLVVWGSLDRCGWAPVDRQWQGPVGNRQDPEDWPRIPGAESLVGQMATLLATDVTADPPGREKFVEKHAYLIFCARCL